jgi:hypothetical protein
MAELVALRPSLLVKWIVMGDFNLIYRVTQTNNDRINYRMINSFKNTSDSLELHGAMGCTSTADDSLGPVAQLNLHLPELITFSTRSSGRWITWIAIFRRCRPPCLITARYYSHTYPTSAVRGHSGLKLIGHSFPVSLKWFSTLGLEPSSHRIRSECSTSNCHAW